MPHGCPIRAPKAKQSKDDSLRKMADRIQARAIRRCGELLKQIKPGYGANQNIREGGHPNVDSFYDPKDLARAKAITQGDPNDRMTLTRADAAEAAGLSERQCKTALRVASVPEDEFNAAIESNSPPTVTQAPCMPIEAIRAALSSVTDA